LRIWRAVASPLVIAAEYDQIIRRRTVENDDRPICEQPPAPRSVDHRAITAAFTCGLPPSRYVTPALIVGIAVSRLLDCFIRKPPRRAVTRVHDHGAVVDIESTGEGVNAVELHGTRTGSWSARVRWYRRSPPAPLRASPPAAAVSPMV
jgi:hypothetical protein